MNKTDLQTLLTARYRRDNWKALLLGVFHDNGANLKLIENPQQENLGTKLGEYRVKELYRLGDLILSDGKTIALFEAEVQNTRIAKNRVGLRSLIQNEIIPGFQDAAMAVFYSPDQPEWRFTFMSKYEFPPEEGGKTVRHETHPKKFTYVLGETESCKTARDRFYELSLKERKTLINVTEAFSVSKLSDEFFEEYKQHYKAFYEFLKTSHAHLEIFGFVSTDEKDLKPVRDFVKKLLGRIVFLYFLQKKGWLGVPEEEQDTSKGDQHFMATIFDKRDKTKDFFTNYLVPLFFETLNHQRPGDACILDGQKFGKVPYLNGGLFEREFDKVDELNFQQNGEERLFESLFHFFNSYNFTIVEDSPDEREVAVDPEMLGHIFENLIEDNKDKGTFYTPKEVVHFMTQEAISLYLQQHLQPDEAGETSLRKFVQYRELDAYIRQHATRIDGLLDSVKICDPAIGSGAFPMGMLLEIFHCKLKIYAETNPGTYFKPAEVKEKIIRNSIYGVDIDKGAIDTARLRFWLSMIVDIDQPRQLPHFDYKFMQGDSLREEFEGIDLSRLTEKEDEDKPKLKSGHQGSFFDSSIQTEIRFDKNEQATIEKLTQKFFQIIDEEEKRKIQEQISQKVNDAINDTLKKDKLKLLLDKGDLEKEAKRQMETTRKITSRLTNKIAAIEKEILGFEEKQTLLYNSRGLYEKPYFLWHLWFAHIFKNKGFDIVIANPPYKRDNAYDDVKDKMKLGSTDLYGMFTTMAMEKLLKPGGSLVFITSDTWLTIISHKEMREKLLARQLHKVLRLPPDTFGATVNTCVFTLTNAVHPKPDFVSTTDAEALAWSGRQIITADLTNISRQKETPDFREKLWHLEKYIGEATNRYAVYQYPQNLIFTNSNLPVFTASPNLFRLMNDLTCHQIEKEIGGDEIAFKLNVRQVIFNGKTVELVRFGDIAEVPQGISTGDNDFYLRSMGGGSYTQIEFEKVLSNEEINCLSTEEKENGIEPGNYDGRYFIPFEKVDSSDVSIGWLPNYWAKNKYFIDWSKDAVNRMKTLTIEGRKRYYGEINKINIGDDKKIASALRNKGFWFRKSLSFSPTGIYSPTFRLGTSTLFQNTSSSIAIDLFDQKLVLGVLCSRLAKFFFKNYLNHTVHTQEGDVVEYPFALFLPVFQNTINALVETIINKQNIGETYNFIDNEQKQIDLIIYELYGLADTDIQEVETWWARRYPKLARYADTRFLLTEALQRQQEELEKRLRDTIAQGENKYVEFKQSLRPNPATQSRYNYVRYDDIVVEIASFLNSDGGTLLVGVTNDRSICGLEHHDFNTFQQPDKADAWSLNFDNVVQTFFGTSVALIDLNLVKVEGKTVAVITVKQRAESPVWLRNRDRGDREEFYVRRSASKTELQGQEALAYIRQVWQ